MQTQLQARFIARWPDHNKDLLDPVTQLRLYHWLCVPGADWLRAFGNAPKTCVTTDKNARAGFVSQSGPEESSLMTSKAVAATTTMITTSATCMTQFHGDIGEQIDCVQTMCFWRRVDIASVSVSVYLSLCLSVFVGVFLWPAFNRALYKQTIRST